MFPEQFVSYDIRHVDVELARLIVYELQPLLTGAQYLYHDLLLGIPSTGPCFSEDYTVSVS